MQSRHAMFLSLLGLAAVASAAPAAPLTRPLRSLQCNCLTFSPLSSVTPCSIRNSQDLDWQAARSLASSYELNIQFASESTITKILAVEEPLPTSVLLRMSDGEPVLPEMDGADEIQDEIICGIGDEVKRSFLGEGEEVEDRHPLDGDVYVGKILGVLLLIIIMYAAGESMYRQLVQRNASIKLTGDEKKLTAELEPEVCSTTDSEKKSLAHSDFS